MKNHRTSGNPFYWEWRIALFCIWKVQSLTLRLPSGENLAPPARIRRLETGRSGGGGEERGGKNGDKRGEMQAGPDWVWRDDMLPYRYHYYSYYYSSYCYWRWKTNCESSRICFILIKWTQKDDIIMTISIYHYSASDIIFSCSSSRMQTDSFCSSQLFASDKPID